MGSTAPRYMPVLLVDAGYDAFGIRPNKSFC